MPFLLLATFWLAACAFILRYLVYLFLIFDNWTLICNCRMSSYRRLKTSQPSIEEKHKQRARGLACPCIRRCCDSSGLVVPMVESSDQYVSSSSAVLKTKCNHRANHRVNQQINHRGLGCPDGGPLV